MCVVAIAWNAHPKWRLVVAGNRDEYHARASAPLGPWDDGSGIIAGRDLVSGGSWMGVSESGRFAVVTNIRDADGPDPNKLSRGALVTDWLAEGRLPGASDRFNPFNLIVTGGGTADCLSNRPASSCQSLDAGIHGLSNAQKRRLSNRNRSSAGLQIWIETVCRLVLPARFTIPLMRLARSSMVQTSCCSAGWRYSTTIIQPCCKPIQASFHVALL